VKKSASSNLIRQTYAYANPLFLLFSVFLFELPCFEDQVPDQQGEKNRTMYRPRRPILFTEVKETLDPYSPTRFRISLCRPQCEVLAAPNEDPTSKERVFGRGVTYFAHDELKEELLPFLMRIPLLPPLAAPAPMHTQQCGQREVELAFRPSWRVACVRPRSGAGSWKAVTFHPIRPCELPIWDLAHSGYVDRLTPTDYPVAHAGETDLTYYGMMMGGLPNTGKEDGSTLDPQ
jgi:hypothetical protein